MNELQELVQERGMRIDKTEEELRSDLADWIDLTQKKQIPTSLLLLSRTLMINVTASDTTEQLSATLKGNEGKKIIDVYFRTKFQ